MKQMKQIERPAKVEPVLDFYECELCHARTNSAGKWRGGDLAYGVDVTLIEHEVGDSYPEGRYTKTKILDVCPKCFDEKLIPWFVAQGGSPREEDSN